MQIPTTVMTLEVPLDVYAIFTRLASESNVPVVVAAEAWIAFLRDAESMRVAALAVAKGMGSYGHA